MNIAVFGANGRVGRLVVAELVRRGHHVRALVHGQPQQTSETVEYRQCDIYDAAQVRESIVGCEAVISCLGSWGTKRQDVLSVGMQHIIPAMQENHVARIVSLTGADAWTESDRPGLIQKIMHLVFGIIAANILKDGETHIQLLAKSTLDWTVVRSPVMNEKGSDAYYLDSTYPAPTQTIHRQAVARALCDQLETHDFSRISPFIHRN